MVKRIIGWWINKEAWKDPDCLEHSLPWTAPSSYLDAPHDMDALEHEYILLYIEIEEDE